MAVTWSLLNLPETESIQISRQPSITFLDKDGRIIASYGDIYGKSIKYNNLPENLINAVIVTEDKRFFNNSGLPINKPNFINDDEELKKFKDEIKKDVEEKKFKELKKRLIKNV